MQILQILQDEKLKENAEIEMAALKKKRKWVKFHYSCHRKYKQLIIVAMAQILDGNYDIERTYRAIIVLLSVKGI